MCGLLLTCTFQSSSILWHTSTLHSLLLPKNIHYVGRPLVLTHAVAEEGLGCCHLAAVNSASVTICVHVCFYCAGYV